MQVDHLHTHEPRYSLDLEVIKHCGASSCQGMAIQHLGTVCNAKLQKQVQKGRKTNRTISSMGSGGISIAGGAGSESESYHVLNAALDSARAGKNLPPTCNIAWPVPGSLSSDSSFSARSSFFLSYFHPCM